MTPLNYTPIRLRNFADKIIEKRYGPNLIRVTGLLNLWNESTHSVTCFYPIARLSSVGDVLIGKWGVQFGCWASVAHELTKWVTANLRIRHYCNRITVRSEMAATRAAPKVTASAVGVTRQRAIVSSELGYRDPHLWHALFGTELTKITTCVYL